MLGYIVRRILQLIPVLIGISFITFTLSFIVPGDPVRAIMGQRSDREIELRIRQRFGLDKPWYVQYFLWVRNLVRNPGDLPEFNLQTGPADGSRLFDLKFSRNTLLATEGSIRPVVNEPYQRNVLAELAEPGCQPPEPGRFTGGMSMTFAGIEQTRAGSFALLKDFQGQQTKYPVDSSTEVWSDGETGGIDTARPGQNYLAWLRPEGFQTNREFTALFDLAERTVIDGMFDDVSSDQADVRQLESPTARTIVSKEHRGERWFFTLDEGNGNSEQFEMLPNALLMLGGNRARVGDFQPGMRVNVALTTKQETTLRAVYDSQSANLSEVAAAREKHPQSAFLTGRVSEVLLTPAVWFDFGRSYHQQREVRDIIRDSFKNTAYLSTVAMLIAILVGITAGIVSAVKPYSALDYFTMTAALIGVSMPVFWLGLMLILLFQGELNWVSGVGYGVVHWLPVNLGLFIFHIPWHQQVILPAITLGTVPMAIIARMTRSSMLEVLNLDYIRTARAKGLSEWAVIMRHALKNALIPIITVIGVDFALLLAGAVLTETVFSWPGMGREIVDAIEFRDFPVVMAGVVLFAFVFVMVNLVVDILYAYVDPRIRYQ
jgi:peptide/nickel transport system permease protein